MASTTNQNPVKQGRPIAPRTVRAMAASQAKAAIERLAAIVEKADDASAIAAARELLEVARDTGSAKE